MNNLDNNFIQHISDTYGLQIDDIIKYKTVYLLRSGSKKYILKRVKYRTLHNNYNYLLAQKFNNVIYPVLTKTGELSTRYNNYSYYLTPYMDNIDYPLDKRLIDYINLLSKLHKTTNIKLKFNKDKFKKIYRRQMRHLNDRFLILDEFLTECETAQRKSIFMWFYLMHYHIIMFIKNLLLELQKKIDDELEKIDQFDYAMIHNSPSIDHFIVTNEKDFLISIDQSIVSLKIYDYIKLFIEYCDYRVDWLGLIQREEITNFEFYYFVFSVIYYIIMNIDITTSVNTSAYVAVNNFLANLNAVDRVISLYRKHISLTSQEVDQGD